MIFYIRGRGFKRESDGRFSYKDRKRMGDHPLPIFYGFLSFMEGFIDKGYRSMLIYKI